MSRKDTIIIAVLINAGLLVVLMTTALKKDDDAVIVEQTSMPSPIVAELPIAKIDTSSHDEVDQVLSKYTNGPASETPATDSSFVQDLQAITATAPVMEVVQPPVEIAAAPATGQMVEVKVKKGDFLEKIAKANGTTVDSIMKINGLSSTRLKIGQVLRISPQSVAAKAAVSAPAAGGEPKFYIVKSGDNPWTIAVKNHMKVDELLKLNNLNNEKARKLKPGDKLRIR